ncbi:MAG: carotenoid 1,2-hydratase [Desulfuromonadaceae bacterium]|nr:carotenoid 1,2-hydratase [Desulfuromonadaceae bacterium]
MRFKGGLWILLFLAVTAAAVFWVIKGQPPPLPDRDQFRVSRLLSGNGAEGFSRAWQVRDFVFPADHGAHPAYKNEWWYFTGNLQGEGGRRFGYQLTFFRFALTPSRPQRSSRWGTGQVYMAHFALTDVAGGRFYNFERFSRQALGLAGAEAEPFRVWLENWSAEGSAGGFFPLHLKSGQEKVGIDLTLESDKPVVLQGEGGLSQKSDEAGNASYYYSLSRLETGGRVRIGDQTFAVEGTSWFDREWGTSALGENQVGWDWFALQLDDGRDLIFYQLRRKDGSADPFSRGTLVEPDGGSRSLLLSEVEIEVLDTWRSSDGRARYPARWRLRIPTEGLALDVEPLVADQEWRAAVRYWEGAVKVKGRSRGRPVGGYGYVELTGYEENP